MVTYPIYVQRDGYHGANPNRRQKAIKTNIVAAELERFINEKLKNQKEPIRSYMYQEIVIGTGIDYETVRDLCFSIDCGHNGFTSIRQGLTFDKAMELVHRGEE